MYKNIATLAEHRPKSTLQQLWRYLSLDRLRDLLVTEELYFAHLPKLSDLLEGRLTERSRNNLLQWSLGRYNNDLTLARQEVDAFEQHRAGFFLNCWHMNEGESYLMWRAYGERGCAIQTTFERAQVAFDTSEEQINGGVVRYVDFRREALPTRNVYRSVIVKDRPFRDEREFRFLHWQPKFGEAFAEPAPDGFRIKVDLSLLIERVVVSPQLDKFPEDITELINAKVDCSMGKSVVRTKTAFS